MIRGEMVQAVTPTENELVVYLCPTSLDSPASPPVITGASQGGHCWS